MKTKAFMLKPLILVAGLLFWCDLDLQAQIDPTITQQPTDQVVTNGGTATFSVSVSGTAPFSYQWMFNGNPLAPIIATVAGNGSYGFSGDGTTATNASLNLPRCVAVDVVGNLYIADQDNDRIRKVDTNGIITTFAGNGRYGFSGDGGAATNASLGYPEGVAVDVVGNVYIADYGNYRIRKVNTNGIITTIAGNGSLSFSGDGGAATNASFYDPIAVAVDTTGNLYIADEYNNRIRKIDTNGIITTIAGNGSLSFSGDGGAATNASLHFPIAVAVDTPGNLYIADYYNDRIRKIDTNGIITTIAGNGSYGFSGDGGAATNASFYDPIAIAVDRTGNLYIADEYNITVRRVGTNGIITTIAGNGSLGFSGDGNLANYASLYYPEGVAVDIVGNLYIADYYNDRIRRVFALPFNLSTLTLANVTTNNIGNYSVIISSSGRSVTSSVVTLNMPAFIAAQPVNLTALLGGSVSFATTPGGSLPLSCQWAFDGTSLLAATNASYPVMNAAQTNAGLYSVRITNLYGFATSLNATLTVAYISQPPTNQTIYDGGTTSFGVLMSAPGSFTYQWLFDGTNMPTSGIISTFAGNGNLTYSGDGKLATNASLYYPHGVAVNNAGDVFIADYDNNRIRKVDTNGIITTVAGNGTYGFSGDGGSALSATLRNPCAVAVDAVGNVYIAEYGNYRIRKVNTNGIITTIAGNGSYGFSGDGGAATNAYLTYPYGVAADSMGDVFIADEANERIRKVDTNGIITTIAGNGSYGFSGDGGLATSATLEYPYGVAVDNAGNVFIADCNNLRIRKVTGNGLIITVAGNGHSGFSGDTSLATNAALSSPYGVSVDDAGNLFIADYNNGRIREVGTNGIINTIAGNGSIGFSGDGGRANSAGLWYPRAVAMDNLGDLFIADNYRVRKVVGTPAYSPLLQSLTVGNVSTNDAGYYSVSVHNTSGSVTSAVATLAVTVQPVITLQPVSQVVVAGSSSSFSSAAGGLGPFTYQWQFNGTNLSDNTYITGAQSNVLILTSVMLTNAGNYQVFVANAFGGTNAAATLTVIPANPIISWANPATIVYGTPLSATQLDASANVPGSLIYLPPIGTLLNAGTNTLTAVFMPTDAVDYNSATGTVSLIVMLPPQIITQPTNQTVGAGTAVVFSVSSGGSLPLTFQWFFNATNLLTNSANPTFSISDAQLASSGLYSVVVTNAVGAVTSAVVVLSVTSSVPVITTQPVSLSLSAGQNASFRVRTHGSEPLTYQWMTNGTDILGSTNASLTMTNVPFGGGGTYTVLVSNSIGMTLSSNALLTILKPDPYAWTTIAGLANVAAFADGTNSSARFNQPLSLAIDATNNLFVTDPGNFTVREITAVGTNWVVSTVTSISYPVHPSGICVDPTGIIYITDGVNPGPPAVIRKLTSLGTNWVVSTIAGAVGNPVGDTDGTNDKALFYGPYGIAADDSGLLWVGERYNQDIREITLTGTNWVVSTLVASNATFQPQQLAFGADGNLYFADWAFAGVQKLSPMSTNGLVITVAGGIGGYPGYADGMNGSAQFNAPEGMAVDKNGNLYVADAGNSTIRKLKSIGTNWLVTTIGGLAGNLGNVDGSSSVSRFNHPTGLTVDALGNIYVADWQADTIRMGTPLLPMIRSQPLSQTANIGTNALFIVTANGGSPLAYQWFFNGTALTDVDTISGSMSNVLLVASVDTTNAGIYVLIVTNSYGSVTSSIATLTVTIPPPQIISSGANFGFMTNQAGFGFSLSGVFGRTIVVDGSTNLLNWTPLFTNTTGTNAAYFIDPTSTNSPGRFYRARSQ